MTSPYPTVRLRYLAQFNPPVAARVVSAPRDEWPLLPMEDIGNFTPPTPTQRRTYEALSTGYSYLEPTDLAYAKVTPCFENGKGLSGADLEGPTFATTEVSVLRPLPTASQKFLAYVVQSEGFRSAAIASMTGAGGLRRVSEAVMKNYPVPIPSTETQNQIADYLDHETAEIDTLIADTQTLIATVALRRRSLIDRTFMGSNWPEVALKYRGELRSGLTLGKSHTCETQSYPYLRVANVQVGRVDLDSLATVDLPSAEAKSYRLHKGDVLMTEGGDRDKLGRGAIWGAEVEPMLHQNHIFAFRCGSSLSPEFLVYGLEATPARVYFDQTARQSTNLASTNSTVVKNFRLPMPPIEDQRAVVDSLDQELTDMSEMVTNAKRVAALARERRAALITAAVTGQIDVTARNKPAAEQLEEDIAQGLHREN